MSAESDVRALRPLDDGLREPKYVLVCGIGSMVLVVLVSLDACVELETSH